MSKLAPLSLMLAAAAFPASAGTAPEVPSATVQVTATRFPEDPATVPASVTVITGQELADRGATDLRSALALVGGVSIAPGGDGGPASSVPEFMGLKEFDAFLLVVDGVPWGGAFNPALSTLDLHDVDRIEVQRGAAPVMYGATSFVGVIHVIHRLPAEARGSASLSAGSHGSWGGAVTLKLPKWAGFDSSLSFDAGKQGFDDPRTEYKTSHLLWRNRMDLAQGSLRFDLDGAYVDQSPASPHPRTGKTLDPTVPLDANHNPEGAFLRDQRITLSTGYDRQFGHTVWSTSLSVARARQNVFRGFLEDVAAPNPDAHAFRQHIDTTDLYFDTHLAMSPSARTRVVVGADHLHGTGTGRGGDFDYFVNLDGSGAVDGNGDKVTPSTAVAADVRIDDHRDFSGLYGFAEWKPVDRLVLEVGLRLNHTEESRRTYALEFGNAPETGEDRRSVTRLTGSAGVQWTFWQAGADRLGVFASVRNAFKPGAIDFGLDSEAEILAPETARSAELGLKGAVGTLSGEVSAFRMDMENLVVSQDLGNGPVLLNAGKERFQGVDASLAWRAAADFTVRAAYGWHDARFTDSIQDFGGTPTQLAGKRLEMSPYQLGGLALTYAPARGLLASVEGNHTGGVYLNKRNTAPSGAYTTVGASLGWREQAWELRVTGQNLSDRRNPVSESELGEGAYYRMPGRRLSATLRFRF